MSVLAITREEPARIYAGLEKGAVFVSTDGGALWARLGDLPVRAVVRSLATSASDPQLLLAVASGNVYRSDDGGTSWALLEGPFGGSARQVLVVSGTPPSSPPALLVWGGNPQPLWRSTDRGASWQGVASPPGGRLASLVQDPESPSSLWALISGDDVDDRVARSEDGGITWRIASDGLPQQTRLSHLTVAGKDGSRTLAVLADPLQQRLFVSRDGGGRWEERNPGLAGQRFADSFVVELDLDATDPSTVYARATRTGFLIPPPDLLLVSRDGGRTFEEAEAFPDLDATTLVSLPGKPGQALLGLSDDGVWKMTGRGAAFEPRDRGLVATDITSLAFHPRQGAPELLATGAAGGFWRSRDHGSSWERVTGLDSATYVTSVTGFPGRLYALSEHLVAHSEDGGLTWERAEPGSIGGCLIPEDTLAVAPSDPDVVMVGGPLNSAACGLFHECALYHSLDGGRTFSCARGNLDMGAAEHLLFDPADPEIAYISDIGRLWRTQDGARQWDLINDDLPVSALAASPLAPSVLWAGTDDGRIWKSPDRGDTWIDTRFPTPEISPPPKVSALVFDPVDPATVYAALDRIGVFVSRDSGATWGELGTASPTSVSAALAADPSDPRRLFAGTRGRSVFRILQTDTSLCVPDDTTLCLSQGRFEVKVAWQDFEGGQGVGHAMSETGDSGWFWFFRPDNVELLVKVLDARTVNGKFWVFYGSLSNVAYTITVRDTETGEVKTYPNPSGEFASVGDTAAFPLPGSPPAPARRSPGPRTAARSSLISLPTPGTGEPAACQPDAETLCLHGGRFRVRVEWQDFQGGSGVGHAVPLSGEAADDSGFFWFFDPANLELVTKVIDGTTVNGNLWFFYGALSNVGYQIEVVDLESGRRKVYDNPVTRFASAGDTETFAEPALCAGIAGLPCPPGQLCNLDPGSCQVADVSGTCVQIPRPCPKILQPVCGCDGESYGNDCERQTAGVAKDHDGACGG